MATRLVLSILGVALLVVASVASVAAIADQSTKFVDAHEVPAFVLNRVELTPGLVGDGNAASEI